MNVVTLIGNLASDVELRELAADKKLATFRLAIDRPGRDAGADFVGVAVWDKQAEVCARHLAKGSRVGIDGRLRSRSWEDADGKRRSVVEVVANRVDFLSRRDDASSDVPFEAAGAR